MTKRVATKPESEPLPDWFHVGARLRFRGGEDIYTVTRIDLETGLWDASNSGSYHFPIFVVLSSGGDWGPAQP